MERQVYYDPKYNRFFGVIKAYPRTYLVTSLHGYYETAKSGDTMRYSIPKSYLKNCVLCENADNVFSEVESIEINGEKVRNGYKIKGYDCIHGREPEIDHTVFKWNNHQHKIAQYRWDKKNNFWAFEKELPCYERDFDYDELDGEFDEQWRI